MYEKFFALAHRPFAAAPSLECIVAHQGYVDARDQLLRCLTDGCGTAVLTASPGLGKSLLCQDLQNRLRGLFTVAYLCSAQFPNRKAMLQAILFELGADYLGLSEDEARLGIVKAAQEAAERGRSLIVIVDEAHLVSTELLQELRGLAEPSPRCATPVRLMLAGQLELEERLADHALDSLNQRIACHAVLEPLTQAESADYILERLAIAGAKTQVFTEDAMAFVVKAADGNPRAIHQLCDHCLLSAYTIEEKPVSLEIARNSLDDLRALPLHWNDAGLLEESEAVEESVEEIADDEFVPTVETPIDHSLASELEPPAGDSGATFDEPSPLWADAPGFGVIEVGGDQSRAESLDDDAPLPAIGETAPEDVEPKGVPEVSEAALFASVAPWPAVPVEAIGSQFGEEMIIEPRAQELPAFSICTAEIEQESLDSESAEAESTFTGNTSEPADEFPAEEPAAPADDADEDGFTLHVPSSTWDEAQEADDSDEESAIESAWSQQIELLDELDPDDFPSEEIIINDHYAALDRASQALSSYLPQAPELLQFLSQYSATDEPRRSRAVATPMHQATIDVAEPGPSLEEDELLATIRSLQDQLRQAASERPQPREPWESPTDPVMYDIVEPPPEPDVSAAAEERSAREELIEPPAEETIVHEGHRDHAPPSEPVRSRFAQLFSRMRQRRREVEDRLRRNADWI